MCGEAEPSAGPIVDWRAYTPSVYEALTGIDGARTLERIKEGVELAAEVGALRTEPLLVVSTPLGPSPRLNRRRQ
ncbi:MAG: hypothetical protein JZD41_05870 [Thermoproteus sp.]|nr:hypothetical protein [Thermoproteus sp.]